MVCYCVVKSSELSKWNRMDPRFFVALRSVEARYLEVKASIALEEIQRRLSLLTPKEKEPCLVLARGQGGPSALGAVEKEYPFLAWAIIEPTLETVYQQQVNALEQLRDRLNNVRQWRRPDNVQT